MQGNSGRELRNINCKWNGNLINESLMSTTGAKKATKSIARLHDALDKLANLKLRMQKAAESCKDPIIACKKAMMQRDKRLGVDMEIDDQMINDRAAKQRLLRDITDKEAALEIDTHASSCRPENTSTKGFKFDPNLMNPEKATLTLADWERTTRHNIERGEREIKNSWDFTPRIEEMFTRTYNDLTQQRLRVIHALNDRIKELSEAQKKIWSNV
ncbi:tektin [Caerostris extrusa]|uniref:Tektin n=1 Tax=Caerostris extrusa TaxID=172846 RepID=A0AAV4UM47_CAEEX|nr:tektin [Caerostris extrusa]